MLSFVTDPVAFFRGQVEASLSWPRALTAPVLCVALSTGTFAILTNKAVSAMVKVLPPPAEFIEAARSFLITATLAMPFFGAIMYVAIWLIATAMLKCVDILRSDSVDGFRLLKLTGLAFYCLVPYLGSALLGAILFQAPSLNAVRTGTGQNDFQLALALRDEIRSTPLLSAITLAGHVFHAWLVVLFVSAYRALTPLRALPGFLMACAFYSFFFLRYVLLGS